MIGSSFGIFGIVMLLLIDDMATFSARETDGIGLTLIFFGGVLHVIEEIGNTCQCESE